MRHHVGINRRLAWAERRLPPLPGAAEPDLRLLLVHELLFLELLLTAEMAAAENGQPEIAPRALDELCAHAAGRRYSERHALEDEHRLANTRDVIVVTSAARPIPRDQIRCDRHYATAYAMPPLAAVAHLPRWFFDLNTSTIVLPWAVRVDPALPGSAWSPFRRTPRKT